jgi:hypothetical protein
MRPRDVEISLLAGFVDPTRTAPHGLRKTTAQRLRARHSGASNNLESGLKTSRKDIADQIGISERQLLRSFPSKGALLAFPPPEIATALVSASASPLDWQQMGLTLRVLFGELDNNPFGRDLLRTLAKLHAQHPNLAASDAHFAVEIRHAIQTREPTLTTHDLALASYFTEILRHTLHAWAYQPGASLVEVADDARRLMTP